MTRLFVSDIDGCLSVPFQPFNLERLTEIANIASTGSIERVPVTPPAFSICSGRAFSYVEAVSQMLALRHPVLFEAGGGCFDPVSARTTWHPALTPEIEEGLGEVRAWLATLIRGSKMTVDIGKKTQAGIIGPDTSEILDRIDTVRAHVATHFSRFKVAYTPFSIDVLSTGLSKDDGLRWLAEITGVSISDMAFIGDTEGDLAALRIAGRSFAPRNAEPEVREAVQYVTSGAVSDGVIEAYRACISSNRTTA